MPPFISAECPKCKHKNRYDLAELKKDGGAIYKGRVYRAVEADEEFAVACERCGGRFKISVPHDLMTGGEKDGKIGR